MINQPQATIYYTARDTLFVVVLLNPKYLKSVNCCIELLAILQNSCERSVFFIDHSFKWDKVRTVSPIPRSASTSFLSCHRRQRPPPAKGVAIAGL